MEGIIIAIITSLASLVGVIVTSIASNKNIETKIQVNQAVTETKLDNLTKTVQAHNEFGRKIPVIEEQIKVINHRLEDLEKSN